MCALPGNRLPNPPIFFLCHCLRHIYIDGLNLFLCISFFFHSVSCPSQSGNPPPPPFPPVSKLSSLAPPANERKKLVPLALMFFCILFNYTILRDTKDVLMVTAPKSGAEVIPFIKTYVNLPAAIGFTGIYASMTNRMEQKDVFYTCVWPFLAFFSLFALIIYPNRSLLHPFGFCDMLASHLPAGFSAPLAIVRNWSFAAFYVMAEMWGSVVASLLFWGFANEVTTVDEAKKYCTLLSNLHCFHCYCGIPLW